MHSTWKKTTITFLFGTDPAHLERIALTNGVPAPDDQQVTAFGNYLASLTGLPLHHATVTVQNNVA